MTATMKLALAGALAIAAGCAEHADESGTKAVRGYFAALSAKDCNGLETLSGGKVAKNFERLGCEKLIEGYQEMGLQLIAVNREVEDGRNSNARIVSAMLSFEGKGTREVMLRVERANGRWVLVSI